MSEYIDREAIKNAMLRYGFKAPDMTVTEFVEDELPTADVEPERHGRWEGYTHSRYCGIDEYGEPIYRDGIVYYCSNPKCRRKTVVKEKFCPSCGFRMDLEDDHGT